ncbi:isoleucine--tRNA ligase [Pelagicoccus sp. SDUM812003]|uniref:isoleucine--tRNA ligase n=1 Tax=Pelagicoccus sp. SDUM812003 TaxID=3041267 RepID=UPI00280E68AB|nr:isoleucine--tRNA ligase [Pelagicoccus sp. SDUM812003]MDQ8202855.1 isoleucine--tRNA ligase [Pelagicoccus sp. SDUM812003]
MSANFKDTLNLPKTAFPMRANLGKREPARVERWETSNLYQKLQEKNADGPLFVLHDGPPFTNGELHLGHALNKTLKEIVLRYKAAQGFRTPYLPGWDCHGLPIEHKVTKELQAEGKDLSTAELRDKCDAFSEHWIGVQREQFRRLGVLADWENEYKTKNPAYEAEILRTLASFVEQGLVYRSKKPVYWSIPCATALAEAEIEYKDHTSPSIWVAFDIPEKAKFGIEKPLSTVIWTTTPWTIPANLAVAVHPRLTYAFVEAGETVFIVAKDLVEKFVADVDLEDWKIVKEVLGQDLEGVESRHPLIDRPSPIVLADYVTTESGTGCVHTAPGHGQEDYLTGLSYGLDIYCPVNDEGKYDDDGQVPDYLVGESVLEENGWVPANGKVLKALDEAGALLKKKNIKHSYPHCWRSKTPVIFRAVDQWFVALDKADKRQTALDAIKQVKWIPEWGEKRITGAVESRPDWCISRQRSWGVPIPAFYDENGEAYMDAGVIKAVADKVASAGTNLWYTSTSEELLSGIELPESWKGKKLKAGTDTLDVWIDSGTSHFSVLKSNPELKWPCDLYLEGSDQHRGWFQSSLWTGVIRENKAPYEKILTHGFLVNQDGSKLSKSDGAMTLVHYMDKFGADVVRLWIASTDFRADIGISEQILAGVGDAYRLFRNTYRYQLSNLYDFDFEQHALPIKELHELDRWALHKTGELAEQVEKAYENYEFHKVFQLCNQFCSVTLSSLYHDILKDRMYTLENSHPLRRSSQTAIYHIFNTLVRLLGPILPFTSDEAWAYFKEETDFTDDALALQDWPSDAKSWQDAELAADFVELFSFRDQVNEKLEGLRSSGEIGRSLDAYVTISGKQSDASFVRLDRYQHFLEELLIVSKVELAAHEKAELAIAASKATGGRCPRCWRWEPQLEGGTENEHTCSRCEKALTQA